MSRAYIEMAVSASRKRVDAWEEVRWAEESKLDPLEIGWLVSQAVEYEQSDIALFDPIAKEVYTGVCRCCGRRLDPYWTGQSKS
jgi:hypothetical protein